MKKKVAVVGGGLGALSAAIYLASDERFELTIFEKNEHLGGKLGEINTQGFRFDTGPSVVTLIDVIKDLLNQGDRIFSNSLQFEQLEIANRNFFEGGQIIDSYSDLNRFKQEIAKISHNSAENLFPYIDRISNIYKRTAEIFLYSQIHEIAHLIKSRNIPYFPDFARIDAFSSMHQINSKYFDDKRILQIFDRYATYNGSSPFLAPGTLNLISYVELVLGSYYIKGGISVLPKTLELLAKSLNIDIHYNAEVEEIITKDGKATALKVNNSIIEFDYIISNSDVVYTHNNLIKGYDKLKSKLNKIEPSISGMVFMWGVDSRSDSLKHHNVFYSSDYQHEFNQIFNLKKVPDDPTIYVAITSKSDPSHAPIGSENWFVLLNMPYLNEQDWDYESKRMRETVLNKLLRFGVDIRNNISYEKIITPQDLYNRYYSNRGSIYGISSNSMFTAFKRQANRSRAIKNLYFAGGSAHPGGGIPLVILSGKHVAEIIKRENPKL